MSTDERRIEYLIARAIIRGLRRRGVGTPGSYADNDDPIPHCKTMIDGQFRIMAVSRHVLAELKDAGLEIVLVDNPNSPGRKPPAAK